MKVIQVFFIFCWHQETMYDSYFDTSLWILKWAGRVYVILASIKMGYVKYDYSLVGCMN